MTPLLLENLPPPKRDEPFSALGFQKKQKEKKDARNKKGPDTKPKA